MIETYGDVKIVFQSNGGRLYGKIVGKTINTDNGPRKETQEHLGRVVDKEHLIFWNRKRGIFMYDPFKAAFLPAPESFSSELKDDGRKKKKQLLDFGDTYFVSELLKKIHYDEVIDAIPYNNKDTIYSMICYYTLNSSANCHAQTWYEGNLCQVLYPDANLTSQRISDFLKAIGGYEVRDAFFKAHIQWLNKYVSKDKASILDSTGIPNSIHFRFQATSNHNGKISQEARLIVPIQRDSGFPILFRVVEGNIVDVSTLVKTANEMSLRGFSTDLFEFDSGYCSHKNIKELLEKEVEFVTRMGEDWAEYKALKAKYAPTLQSEYALVEYRGRYVYVKQVPITLDGKEVYAYLCYDVDRAGDECHKAMKRSKKKARESAKKKPTPKEMHEIFQNAGLFILLSSLPYKSEDIIEVYYIRQAIEQFFDLMKGLAKLAPLRIHSEEAMYGHLLMSFISSVISTHIQNETDEYIDREARMFLALRNQKCIVFQNKITTYESQSDANYYYKKFSIGNPDYFDRTDNGWEPKYGLIPMEKDEDDEE
ncbi:MAG: transposase [Clostridia bacterium]|nr:transposase [Clostridia bacterium]